MTDEPTSSNAPKHEWLDVTDSVRVGSYAEVLAMLLLWVAVGLVGFTIGVML